ncbi:hypothetical protein MKY48_03360 [Paenibacillus sp. FSL W8-0187]|jgi:hypothetical protein|uniref:Uncharacterized protein n=1 Tax=Paenibacillus lautus TaxID=1401 RepID=A0A1R1B3B4_PAELA|nr:MULTISPECIES: hypothetical protein [Paenibacillus]MBT2765191.1 hypothetical protein [Paenibacillus sp. ISL-20]OME93598.1 hypothetical protein BK123_10090 [Paenibacillus lautus]GIO99402.1 hypothetical protein J14TS5_44880 [Paenibacillus lautus]
MDIFKRIVLLMVMYAFSAVLLYVASQHTPYLLPVIWLSALMLLLCGIGYLGYHYFFKGRRKRS